ncbi:hypothetical protein [Granulosicoccus antarcticus]|nr:hypothetical protein [Granulosicoccus antarcticus]
MRTMNDSKATVETVNLEWGTARLAAELIHGDWLHLMLGSCPV